MTREYIIIADKGRSAVRVVAWSVESALRASTAAGQAEVSADGGATWQTWRRLASGWWQRVKAEGASA